MLIIAPEYGYGKTGSPPTIPADATLHVRLWNLFLTLKFEVELINWIADMDVSDKKDGGVMKKILKEIQSGKFAKEFVTDYHSGKKKFEKLRHADDKHPIEVVGGKLRGMMKWL